MRRFAPLLHPTFEDSFEDSLGDCSTTVQFPENRAVPNLVQGVHDAVKQWLPCVLQRLSLTIAGIRRKEEKNTDTDCSLVLY